MFENRIQTLNFSKATHRYVVVIAFLEKFQASHLPGAELIDDHTLWTEIAVNAFRIVMQEDQRLGDLLR